MTDVKTEDLDFLTVSDRIISGGPLAGRNIHFDPADKSVKASLDRPTIDVDLNLDMESVRKAELKAGLGTGSSPSGPKAQQNVVPMSGPVGASGQQGQQQSGASNKKSGQANIPQIRYGFRPAYRSSLTQSPGGPALSRVQRVYSKDERRLQILRMFFEKLKANAKRKATIRVEDVPLEAQEELLRNAEQRGQRNTAIGDIETVRSKLGKSRKNVDLLRADAAKKNRRKSMMPTEGSTQKAGDDKKKPWGGKWHHYLDLLDGPIISSS